MSATKDTSKKIADDSREASDGESTNKQQNKNSKKAAGGTAVLPPEVKKRHRRREAGDTSHASTPTMTNPFKFSKKNNNSASVDATLDHSKSTVDTETQIMRNKQVLDARDANDNDFEPIPADLDDGRKTPDIILDTKQYVRVLELRKTGQALSPRRNRRLITRPPSTDLVGGEIQSDVDMMIVLIHVHASVSCFGYMQVCRMHEIRKDGKKRCSECVMTGKDLEGLQDSR